MGIRQAMDSSTGVIMQAMPSEVQVPPATPTGSSYSRLGKDTLRRHFVLEGAVKKGPEKLEVGCILTG